MRRNAIIIVGRDIGILLEFAFIIAIFMLIERNQEIIKAQVREVSDG